MDSEEQKLSGITKKEASQTLVDKVSSEGFTWHVAILALVCFIISAWIITRSVFRMGPGIDYFTVPVPGAFVFVLPLMFLGYLFKYFFKKPLLSQAQLVTLYCILAVGGTVMSQNVFWILLGNIMSLNSLSSGVDPIVRGYEETFQSILDQMSTMVIPKSEDAFLGFFVGSTTVPWGDWIGPIIVWTLYLTCIVWTFVCIAAIFRKYWTEVQHYTFPLTIPPVEMIASPRHHTSVIPSFWREHWMWLGIAVPVLIGLWEGIIRNYFMPGLPTIQMSWSWWEAWDRIPHQGFWKWFLAPWPGFRIGIYPLVIGIAYLVPTDIVFSLWFFHLTALCGMRGLAGVFHVGEVGEYGGLGHAAIFDQFYIGAITLSVVTVFMAREHLKNVLSSVISKHSDSAIDSNEGLPYRLAVLGLISGIAFVLLFNLVMLGVSFRWSVVFFLVLFAVFLVFARARAEVGLPDSRPNTNKPDAHWLWLSFGGKVFGRTSITGAGLHVWLTFGTLGSTMALSVESYKIADTVGMSRRSMTRAILFAVPAALIIAFILGLPYVYDKGFGLLDYHWQYQARGSFREATYMAFPSTHPEGTPLFYDQSFKLYVQPVIFLFVVFLIYMRSMFVWWPFHPIGYVFSMSDTAASLWFSFFIAWFIKTLIIRYRGYPGLRKARPFFFGLVTGTIIWSGVSFLISLFLS